MGLWSLLRMSSTMNVPGGRPRIDFELLGPFQIIINPKLQRKADSDWLLLAAWQDLTAMKLRK